MRKKIYANFTNITNKLMLLLLVKQKLASKERDNLQIRMQNNAHFSCKLRHCDRQCSKHFEG